MGIFSSLEISGSALTAERQRAQVVATNMANAETTKTASGGPYQRQEVVFSASGRSGFGTTLSHFGDVSVQKASVHVSKVVTDSAPPIMKYEPGNPEANSQGFVAYPNINPVSEMVDLMESSRAYQMNASAVSSEKDMIQQAIEILR